MRALALAVLLGAAGVQAQDSFLDVEAGGSYEHLTNGRDPWSSVYLEAVKQFAPRRSLYGLARETERFDFRDSEFGLGVAQPLGAWTVTLEGTYSPDHSVLAENSVSGQLTWAGPHGWVVGAGGRRSEYTTSRVNLLTGNVERYWGSWRAGYTLYNGRPEGSGSATSHRVSLDRYYDGERSRVGVSGAWGREVENQGPPTGIITSDIRNLTVGGRHFLSASWALAWDGWTQRQGDLYRRTGGRLGLRYRF